MTQRFWIIAYDIAHPRRLRRVAALMERFGVRVQKSVFECWLDDAAFNDLTRRITPLLHPREDSVRYYPLCAQCRAAAATHCEGDFDPPENYYIV